MDTTHHTPVGEAEPSRHADPSSALEVEASCRNDALHNMPVSEVLILAPVRNWEKCCFTVRYENNFPLFEEVALGSSCV